MGNVSRIGSVSIWSIASLRMADWGNSITSRIHCIKDDMGILSG